jgi:hypothetical protein
MHNGLEIAGSIISFAGAGWLSIDSLRVRQHVRSEAGAMKLLTRLKRAGMEKLLTDAEGKPLNSEQALRLWFAAGTLAWNWIGLVLITAGFGLELVGKFIG